MEGGGGVTFGGEGIKIWWGKWESLLEGELFKVGEEWDFPHPPVGKNPGMWDVIHWQTFAIDDKIRWAYMIEENNCVWICLIKFSILVERLSASSFSNSDFIKLDLITEEFFDVVFEFLDSWIWGQTSAF